MHITRNFQFLYFCKNFELTSFLFVKTKGIDVHVSRKFCELCLFSNYFVYLMHTLHSFICTIVKFLESMGYVSLLNFSFIKRFFSDVCKFVSGYVKCYVYNASFIYFPISNFHYFDKNSLFTANLLF